MSGAGPSPAVATTLDEERVLVPCGDELLSGVLTRAADPGPVGILFLAGRWSVTSIGRSRLFVHLARRLAGRGFASLRLDYLGLGESTGRERRWRLEAPFREEPDAAVAWLAGRGVERVLVVGTCGGARLALDAAARLPAVVGAVLLAPPVREYAKGERTSSLPVAEFLRRGLRPAVLAGLADRRARRRYAHHLRGLARRLRRRARARLAGPPGGRTSAASADPASSAPGSASQAPGSASQGPGPGPQAPGPGPQGSRSSGPGAGGQTTGEPFEWVSRRFLGPLARLAERGVPVLVFFGEDDAYYRELCRGRAGGFDDLLARGAGVVELVTVPGRFHALAQADIGPVTLAAVEDWLTRHPLA